MSKVKLGANGLPEPKLEKLPVQRITMDEATQPRQRINFGAADEYADLMQEGVIFPPVVVFSDGQHYWLADGFHRMVALKKIDAREAEAHVYAGTLRDAQLYAAGANATHGLSRTWDDKRRAVILLLSDPEWQAWSDRVIAEKTGTSHTFVADVRARHTEGGQKTRRTRDGRVMEISGIQAENQDRAEKLRARKEQSVADGLRGAEPPVERLSPPLPQPVAHPGGTNRPKLVFPDPNLALEMASYSILGELRAMEDKAEVTEGELVDALSWTINTLQEACLVYQTRGKQRMDTPPPSPGQTGPGGQIEGKAVEEAQAKARALKEERQKSQAATGEQQIALAVAEVTPQLKEKDRKKKGEPALA